MFSRFRIHRYPFRHGETHEHEYMSCIWNMNYESMNYAIEHRVPALPVGIIISVHSATRSTWSCMWTTSTNHLSPELLSLGRAGDSTPDSEFINHHPPTTRYHITPSKIPLTMSCAKEVCGKASSISTVGASPSSAFSWSHRNTNDHKHTEEKVTFVAH